MTGEDRYGHSKIRTFDLRGQPSSNAEPPGRSDHESGQREIVLREGELTIVPRGVRHLPIATDEVHVMLLEPKTTHSTGGVDDPRGTHGEWL